MGRIVALGILGLAFGLLGSGSVWAADLSPKTALRALQATVLIKSERVVLPQSVVTTASGFFVSDQGYLLTHRGVVADSVEISENGQTRVLNAPVTSLRVALIVPGGDLIEIAAEAVKVPVTSSLVLLKVARSPAAWLTAAERLPGAGTPVWRTGFAGTGFVPEEPTQESASMVRGTLSAADESRPLVTPAFAGGPLFDAQGAVVGVVAATPLASPGGASFIPLGAVHALLGEASHQASCSPTSVYSEMPPITVEVSPCLRTLGDKRGKAVLATATDILAAAPLHRAGDKLVANLAVPESLVHGSQAISVTVETFAEGSQTRDWRRQLKIVRSRKRASVRNQEVSGELVEVDYDGVHDEQAQAKRQSMSRIASTIKLRPENLKRDEPRPTPRPKHGSRRRGSGRGLYSALSDPLVRDYARNYDRLENQIIEIGEEIEQEEEANRISDPVWGPDPTAQDELEALREEFRQTAEKMKIIEGQLRSYDVCRCQDDRWHRSDEATCRRCYEPDISRWLARR